MTETLRSPGGDHREARRLLLDSRHDGAVSEAPDAVPAWAVVVLTGGGSRRMGQDKATLDVAGATLLDRTLGGIPAGIDVIVAGPPVAVARSGVRFAQEDPPGGGPVAGLEAALTTVAAPVVVVLATDLPLVGTLPEGLVQALLDTDEGGRVPDAVLAADATGRPSSSARPIAWTPSGKRSPTLAQRTGRPCAVWWNACTSRR